MSSVNLLDVVQSGARGQVLEVIQLGRDQTAMIPFTTEMAAVNLHFLRTQDMRSFVRCNAKNDEECVLCRTGYKPDTHYLLPVYEPFEKRIGVVRMSSVRTPKSLLSQLAEALAPLATTNVRPLLLVSKDDIVTFQVKVGVLKPDADDGAAVIKNFLDDLKAGRVTVDSVIPQMTNAQLENVPEIATRLSLLV